MSMRLRFALACAGVFFVIGTLAVTAVFFVARTTLQYRASVFTPQNAFWSTEPEDYELARSFGLAVHATYRTDVLDNLRNAGVLAVLGGTGLAFGAGWRTAGMVLIPLRNVTDTARRIVQNHDLSERIGY
ncbi:hypothetical protein, partial [Nonomuraea helvata]